jgi:carotenoid cleavage dioxygenase-like enzyme
MGALLGRVRETVGETRSGEATSEKKAHPYLDGNFAPIQTILPLTPCAHTGRIPEELAGGQYVRNGGNPVTNEDMGRDAHWFDGDGMLSGVLFRRHEDGIRPEFVNQYILTDLLLASQAMPSLRTPILPSIATLVSPASTLARILLRIARTLFIVLLSHLPLSRQAIRKISVANTSLLYHDGRALATCESGPPMRISLPDLSTVGWFDGCRAENEAGEAGEAAATALGAPLGGHGVLSFMRQWTTAHPRVDPITKELVLFHSTFVAPFVRYSVLPETRNRDRSTRRLVNAAIPGIASPKMMHDFGVSRTHTVIMDLPLSLDPRNLLRNEAVVAYDAEGSSRFGVFPRWEPSAARWFETRACCIFHTANTWDVRARDVHGRDAVVAVDMLACRLTSASLVYAAGDVAAPQPRGRIDPSTAEEEQCRLYYYRFDLRGDAVRPTYEFALSAIPFEFPSVAEHESMGPARFVYGCSVSDSTFGAALGRAVKIDSLVKMDVTELVGRGVARERAGQLAPVSGCVDERCVDQVLAQQAARMADGEQTAAAAPAPDPIQIFKLPPGQYAQEPRFVARREAQAPDDGFLLTYVFDEGQLAPDASAPPSALSELWIVDARRMACVLARIHLPLRVPYGLHGAWFGEELVRGQRAIAALRAPVPTAKDASSLTETRNGPSDAVRDWLLRLAA